MNKHKNNDQLIEAAFKKLAKDFDTITPTSVNDLKPFRAFFSKEQIQTYGNSWSYIIQGVNKTGPNNLGYKYFDGENISIFSIYPKVEAPHEPVVYWIRPMGPKVIEKIDEISTTILKDFKIPSYQKKITPLQFYRAQELGWNDVYSFKWHSESPMEDDTYPEIILDRQKTLEIVNSSTRAHQISRIKMKIDDYLSKHTISISDKNFEETAWKITNDFFENKAKNKNLSIPEDYHNMIYNNPKRPEISKVIVEVDGTPQGYIITERLKDTTNIHASIAHRDLFKYLPDYCTIHVLENSTTQYINTGGSEDLDRHLFEIKYLPIKMNQMFWATNASKL
ncbi:hypothetical protein GF357_01755 [Candidatus Dojkabacteria bacterium]|nr:hypothetical protein [Candidatus Dojkabacteria bacterium]